MSTVTDALGKDYMILSIASQKGGVAKTSTSISLASYAAKKGKTLIIDLDAQANTSKVLIPEYGEIKKGDSTWATIVDRKPLPIFPSTIKNLHVSPSHILLAEADISLYSAIDHREERLKTGLQPIISDYEHIIIDTPPSLGWCTLNALTVATHVLIPVSPGFFELDSLVQISKIIQDVQENFNPSLEVSGIVFVMADTTISSKESLRILRQAYTDAVCKTIVHRAVAMRDASFQHQSIFDYEPDSRVASDYELLAKEIGL